jgi:hypothetical protein
MAHVASPSTAANDAEFDDARRGARKPRHKARRAKEIGRIPWIACDKMHQRRQPPFDLSKTSFTALRGTAESCWWSEDTKRSKSTSKRCLANRSAEHRHVGLERRIGHQPLARAEPRVGGPGARMAARHRLSSSPPSQVAWSRDQVDSTGRDTGGQEPLAVGGVEGS